jgi:Virulence-associated protein E
MDDDNIIRLAALNDAEREWLDACIKGETGKPLPILANVLTGLRAQWPDHFRHDEMLCAPALMKPLADETPFALRAVTDVDVGLVQEQLQHLGLKRIAKDVVHQAVDIVAHECRFHPVRDYLQSLTWDSKRRLDRLLPDYFGAETSPYTAQIGRLFLPAEASMQRTTRPSRCRCLCRLTRSAHVMACYRPT